MSELKESLTPEIRSIPREVVYDDGTHHRALLGFIILSMDLVMEENIFRLCPDGVGPSVTRLKTHNDCNVARLAEQVNGMAEAASILQPQARPYVVCYACTSGSIVIGEDRVRAEISRGAPWAKPSTLVTGAVNALRRFDAQKIVVATPYLDEINTVEAEFLRQKSFDVLDIQGLNIEDCEAMGGIERSFIRKFAVSVDRPDAGAICVSCGGIRTMVVL